MSGSVARALLSEFLVTGILSSAFSVFLLFCGGFPHRSTREAGRRKFLKSGGARTTRVVVSRENYHDLFHVC